MPTKQKNIVVHKTYFSHSDNFLIKKPLISSVILITLISEPGRNFLKIQVRPAPPPCARSGVWMPKKLKEGGPSIRHRILFSYTYFY